MIKVTRLTFIPASRTEANAVAALSGPGEDLRFQTCVPMLGWGTEIAVISVVTKMMNCVSGPSVLCFGPASRPPVRDVLL